MLHNHLDHLHLENRDYLHKGKLRKIQINLGNPFIDGVGHTSVKKILRETFSYLNREKEDIECQCLAQDMKILVSHHKENQL